jgi:uncharacterized protein YecT (DUF1311 family)
MKFFAAPAFLVTICLTTPCMAADIQRYPDRNGKITVSISGEILPDDEKKFTRLARLIAADKEVTVKLDSKGGWNRHAAFIGQIIREMGYETRLEYGDRCDSACTLIFFAGTYRSVELGTRLGFHSSRPETGEVVRDEYANKKVAEYLVYMGAPQQIIDLFPKADPCCLTYVSYSQAKNWGVLEEKPARLALPPVTVQQSPAVSYLESLHWLWPKVGARSAAAQTPSETNEPKPQELLERLQNECAEQILLNAITFCLREKEEEFGNELDQVYKTALALAGTNNPLLRESQRGWLKYQESNCKLQEQLATEGEMYKRNHEAHCLLKMTLERLEELRWIVGCLNREC